MAEMKFFPARLVFFAGLMLTIVGFLVFYPPAAEPAPERPPQYEALVMPPGLPPLPIQGVRDYSTFEGRATLWVGASRIDLVGIPVMIYEAIPDNSAATVAPSLEARR